MKEQKDTTEHEAAPQQAVGVDALVMRCATCKYWQGDKEKALKMYAENPLSMDLFKGWPDDGSCGIDYEWLNTEIHGDAIADNTVDANFGCVYWGA